MIQAGEKLPTFSLSNQAGENRTNESYAGKWLVLYIYPKDDTPGCTIQGKSFSATKEDFAAVQAVPVGLSADDVESHKAFCDKFAFTVELLADPQAELLGALAAGQSEFHGTSYWNRTTFLVDPSGVVKKVYEKVDPNGHEHTVLADLKALQG